MSPWSIAVTLVLLLVLGLFVLWPKTGLLFRIRRLRQTLARVLVEDALKHIFDCEYRDVPCDLNSLAGRLQVSSDKAADIARDMSARGLIVMKGDALQLTAAGRAYALRIIRNHRLWERFLADQTGVRESEWHVQAEAAEHKLTTKEAERLASQIGNPVIDPHGDPIPSAHGEIRSRSETELSCLEAGAIVRISHIEDEPHSVYSQILANGLYLGMKLKVVEANAQRIKLTAGGDTIILSPVIAANISVVPLRDSEQLEEHETLTSLGRDRTAVVVGVSRACRGPQRRRLMDLGIVKGSEITPRMESTGGDPKAYEVRGALVALRKAQSDHIFIREKGKSYA